MARINLLTEQPPFSEKEDIRTEEWKRASDFLKSHYTKIIVLDDDPTGSQTVYDLPVFTGLDRRTLKELLEDSAPVVYLLTNSRSMSAEKSRLLHRELIENLTTLWRCDNPFLILSRSDSTLRGHYPLETEVLSEGWDKFSPVDGEILIPFFDEGGRYTIDDIHYVKEGEALIPVGETEFARDSSFSFSNSNLNDYVEEKTGGRIKRNEVVSIALTELRSGSDSVYAKLKETSHYRRIVVNAVSYDDLKSFLPALAKAVSQGKRYMIRCAASFVKVLAGLEERNYLKGQELITSENSGKPGLIVAGSYVGKTSRQLNNLKESGLIREVRFNIRTALHAREMEREIRRCKGEVNALMRKRQTVCLFTENAGSRNFLTANEGEEGLTDLELSGRISNALVNVVSSVENTPSFVLTKGGITSHDIASKALKIHRAKVLGQITAGVPVWLCGSESRWPEIPLIIFPGNVGEDNTLAEVIKKLL